MIDEGSLADGDHLTIGESILKFISQTSVEARYHEEIYQLATHDALTDLCNRRHFTDCWTRKSRAPCATSASWRCASSTSTCSSRSTTATGTSPATTCCARSPRIMRRHVRNDDIAARIGGEEFAVMLPECDAAAALTFAERLREEVAEAVFTPGGESAADHDQHRHRRAVARARFAAAADGCGRCGAVPRQERRSQPGLRRKLSAVAARARTKKPGLRPAFRVPPAAGRGLRRLAERQADSSPSSKPGASRPVRRRVGAIRRSRPCPRCSPASAATRRRRRCGAPKGCWCRRSSPCVPACCNRSHS